MRQQTIRVTIRSQVPPYDACFAPIGPIFKPSQIEPAEVIAIRLSLSATVSLPKNRSPAVVHLIWGDIR